MTVVVGTAGHIDHGKTSLLRALTGIDADRLPEERRRGMTIDVGYAHLGLPDGSELDFVDVPGHDALVGNMLVGAGEIDAALLVVAADDGPRAQTLEHLELLDALEIRHGIAVVTKTDLVATERVAAVAGQVADLLHGTTLEGSAVLAVSSERGEGIEALRVALLALRDHVGGTEGAPGTKGPSASRLAIDRVFTVKGRGTVVTGTLRGRPLAMDAHLRQVPGEQTVRVRGLQVHGRTVDRAAPGRTAIAVAGVAAEDLHRGMVLTDDPDVRASGRVLVRLRAPVADGARVRLHLGTASVDARVGRSGRDALDLPDDSDGAILRLAAPIAMAPGDRFVLRRPSGADPAVGGLVLDTAPARGISRRRQTVARVARLADVLTGGDRASVHAARLELHGALPADGRVELASDVQETVAGVLLAEPPATVAAARAATAVAIRRLVSVRRDEAVAAAAALIDDLVATGHLVHDGEHLRLPGAAPATEPEDDPVVAAAMDRLEAALASPTPPSLADAAAQARCPGSGVRRLEQLGRIVVLGPDLAYAAATYTGLERTALELAARAPLTPAAFRDATGTSRKYVMAILEDLDRRGILVRTPAGHVIGPRAGLVAR